MVIFKLLGKILVTYHNPNTVNLHAVNPTKFFIMMLDGWTVEVKRSAIPTKTALLAISNVENAGYWFSHQRKKS